MKYAIDGDPKGPKGIGGWMFFPILNLILSVLVEIYYLYTIGFHNENLSIALNSVDPVFTAVQLWFIGSLCTGIFVIISISYTLYLIFREKNKTIYLIIISYFLIVLSGFSNYALEYALYKHGPKASHENNNFMGNDNFAGAPWLVIYFVISRRSKNTFVKPGW